MKEHQYETNRREFCRKTAVAVSSTACAALNSIGVCSDENEQQARKSVNKRRFEPATQRTAAIAHYEKLQFGMFVHYTINTFLDKPFWETLRGPLPSPRIYAPGKLDVDQWIVTAKEAQMRYAVLIAKHYLGFALWDSKYTDYDVAASSDRTDVVNEFVQSCRRHGLEPGLYYALGVDVAHKSRRKMSDEQWYAHARAQITELLTKYGPIPFFWFDAMGRVPQRRWQEIYDTIKSLQPDCLAITNHGHGSNGTRLRFWPTDVLAGERTLPPPEGHDPRMKRDGKTYYIPMEVCDVSAVGTFSKGWFWEPGEQIKEVQRELIPLHRNAAKRHANLLLNVTVNRAGQVPETTVQRLRELGRAIRMATPRDGRTAPRRFR